MEKQMNKRLRYGLIVVILAAVAIFAAFWALVLRQHQISGFQQTRVPPPGVIHGDFQYFYVADTIISTINIALLAILSLIYINIYIKTRSQFTFGLIIFALVFLVQNVT